MPRPVRLMTITALTGAMLLGTAACGNDAKEPSAENFCATLTQEAGKLRDSTARLRDLAASSDAARSVGDIASAAKSYVDLANIYDQLSQVAPPEVKADVTAIRTSFDDLTAGADVDATKLASAAKETFDSLRNSGELQRLNDYAKNECGVQIG